MSACLQLCSINLVAGGITEGAVGVTSVPVEDLIQFRNLLLSVSVGF